MTGDTVFLRSSGYLICFQETMTACHKMTVKFKGYCGSRKIQHNCTYALRERKFFHTGFTGMSWSGVVTTSQKKKTKQTNLLPLCERNVLRGYCTWKCITDWLNYSSVTKKSSSCEEGWYLKVNTMSSDTDLTLLRNALLLSSAFQWKKAWFCENPLVVVSAGRDARQKVESCFPLAEQL